MPSSRRYSLKNESDSELDRYRRFTILYGARWLVTLMKLKKFSHTHGLFDFHLEVVDLVFRKMYDERTKGLTQEVKISHRDLIYVIHKLGGYKSQPHQYYYKDNFDAASYELYSKSKNYTFCLEIRYDEEKVRSIWFAMKGTPGSCHIDKIYMPPEQFYYLIKDFVDYMDNLAEASYKASEIAGKILLLEDIKESRPTV